MGFPERFIMVGMEGPNISASSRPTSCWGKWRLRARAKLTDNKEKYMKLATKTVTYFKEKCSSTCNC